MKKVLILAYFFPPNPVIGSQRPAKLAKYFLKYGWEPVILTSTFPGRVKDGIEVIEVEAKSYNSLIKSKVGFSPDKGLHEQLGIDASKKFVRKTWKSKIIKLLSEVINFPDVQRGWYKSALESASKLLSKEKVDAIISTSSPVTSHLVARKLKNKFKVPWIADLRDLWTQNIGYNKNSLVSFFERRLELKTLADADVIVTVTNPWADAIKSLHKDKKVVCITNGYDSEDFSKIPSRLTDKFTVTHTGSLYNGKRDPTLLFEVVTELIKLNRISKDVIEIRFYGTNKEEWLIRDLKKYNLEECVKFYGFLPRLGALEKQRESQLLLILQDSGIEATLYPAKIFEYFGAKRPIIATGPRGSIVKELLEKTNTGKFAENFNQLENILLYHYKEFISSGEVKYYGNDDVTNYSYDLKAKQYSELLEDCVLSRNLSEEMIENP